MWTSTTALAIYIAVGVLFVLIVGFLIYRSRSAASGGYPSQGDRPPQTTTHLSNNRVGPTTHPRLGCNRSELFPHFKNPKLGENFFQGNFTNSEFVKKLAQDTPPSGK